MAAQGCASLSPLPSGRATLCSVTPISAPSPRLTRPRPWIVARLTVITGVVSLLLLNMALGAAVPGAQAAKKKRLTPQAALSAALDGRRDDIQGCALRLAGTATRIQVVTHLTLNNQGHLINSRVAVDAPGADAEGIKACVLEVLKTIKFPRSDAPLITIDRTWEMKLQ